MKISIFKNLHNRILNLKLVYKLLISYFILILVSMVLISTFFYHNFSNFVDNSIIYYAKQSYEQAYSFLSYKLNNIKEISEVPIKSNEFSDILREDMYSKTLLHQMQTMKKLLVLLSSLEDNSNIVRARLYVYNDFIYSNDNRNIFNIALAKKAKWYHILSTQNRAYLWAPSSYLGNDDNTEKYIQTPQVLNKDVLSLTRFLRDPDNYTKSIGAVRFDFYKNDIIKILNKADSIKNSFTYIENSSDEIVAASSPDLLKKYRVKFQSLNNPVDFETKWEPHNFAKEDALIGYRSLENTDWHMVTVIPYGSIYSTSRNMLNKILILCSIILAFALLLAYLIACSVTNGLSELSSKMRSLHNGKLESIATTSRNDEIGMLIEDYNYMAARMTELTEEQYKSGQILKTAELKALQSQINPHFLYNTLDMINWLALGNKGEEITATVDALAQFYKISLSNGKDVISIRDEINHTSSYFQIQNMRFNNNLSLILDIDEPIMDYGILKITLQPIVENAIIHGILCKETKSGTIHITGYQNEKDIILEVQDDGIGISEEALKSIQQNKLKSRKGSGFGIKNINERIKLYYGSQYGLSFKSEPNKGTIVKIRIAAKPLNNTKLL